LLAKGANVNAKNGEGTMPLPWPEWGGWTPLHFAVSGDHKDIAELLLGRRAKVNEKDNNGEMPLSIAIQTHHNDIAALLRAHGAQGE
jgi:ankyrin repeat protein